MTRHCRNRLSISFELQQNLPVTASRNMLLRRCRRALRGDYAGGLVWGVRLTRAERTGVACCCLAAPNNMICNGLRCMTSSTVRALHEPSQLASTSGHVMRSVLSNACTLRESASAAPQTETICSIIEHAHASDTAATVGQPKCVRPLTAWQAGFWRELHNMSDTGVPRADTATAGCITTMAVWLCTASTVLPRHLMSCLICMRHNVTNGHSHVLSCGGFVHAAEPERT